MTMSFLRFADDDLLEEGLKTGDRPHWIWKYVFLYLDISAIISVYLFVYDGKLYKIGLFIGLLTLGLILRTIYGVSFDFGRFALKLVGMLLAFLLILTVWSGQSERIALNFTVPCHKIMSTQVDKQGNIIVKDKSTTHGNIETSTTGRSENSKTDSKTKKKTSKSFSAKHAIKQMLVKQNNPDKPSD